MLLADASPSSADTYFQIAVPTASLAYVDKTGVAAFQLFTGSVATAYDNPGVGNQISEFTIYNGGSSILFYVTKSLGTLNAIPNQTNILDQIAELTGETSEEIVIHIESDQEYVERVAEIEGEPEPDVVEYTDPAGNTFEAPVVIDDFITDEEEDAIMEQMLVPVAPERVKFSVDNTETTTEFDFDLNFEDEEEGDSNQFFL